MNPSGAVSQAQSQLRQAGIDNAAREARWLVEGLSLPRDAVAYAARVARRAAREPLAYILGTAPFLDFDLAVSPATLIPRPDSQTLIAAAIAAFPHAPPARVLDLGTGTGCLLLAALRQFPAAWGLGTDRVPLAARLAAANAARLGLAHRAAFLVADWAAALDATFPLVLCNPPYIPTAVIGGLMPEVAGHEPPSALDGGTDGLVAYRILVPGIGRLLAPGGAAVLECGIGQAPCLDALAAAHGFRTSLIHDPGGHARAITLRRATDS